MDPLISLPRCGCVIASVEMCLLSISHSSIKRSGTRDKCVWHQACDFELSSSHHTYHIVFHSLSQGQRLPHANTLVYSVRSQPVRFIVQVLSFNQITHNAYMLYMLFSYRCLKIGNRKSVLSRYLTMTLFTK